MPLPIPLWHRVLVVVTILVFAPLWVPFWLFLELRNAYENHGRKLR